MGQAQSQSSSSSSAGMPMQPPGYMQMGTAPMIGTVFSWIWILKKPDQTWILIFY